MMTRTIWLIAIAVSGWLAIGLQSQTPTDFSGRWTADPAPAAGSTAALGDMGSGWGTTFTITQSASQLVVEPQVFTRYDLQPQPRFLYSLDGSETRNMVMMGRGFQPQASHARWEGQSLTITTVHSFADPVSGQARTVDVTQKLTLEAPCTSAQVIRLAALGGRSSTTRTVYSKAREPLLYHAAARIDLALHRTSGCFSALAMNSLMILSITLGTHGLASLMSVSSFGSDSRLNSRINGGTAGAPDSGV